MKNHILNMIYNTKYDKKRKLKLKKFELNFHQFQNFLLN